MYYFLFFALGIGGFFWGFIRLQRKRLIENIPTSTVRSLAMGLVELIGRAKKSTIILAPLSAQSCVYFRYRVQRYQSSGKRSRWVTIARGDSSQCPFWIEDDTGQVLIMPHHAEIILPVSYHYQTGLGRSLSDNLIQFMKRSGLSHRGLFGNHTLRFDEWVISENQETYVLGSAQKQGNLIQQNNNKLMKRLQALKQDTAQMKQIDANQDGIISDEEWAHAVSTVERELLEEQIKESSNNPLSDVVVARGTTEKTFIISNHSQKGLVSKLFWQSVLGIYGGCALALGMLWLILEYFGVF